MFNPVYSQHNPYAFQQQQYYAQHGNVNPYAHLNPNLPPAQQYFVSESGANVPLAVAPTVPRGGKKWIKRKNWSDKDILAYLKYCKTVKAWVSEHFQLESVPIFLSPFKVTSHGQALKSIVDNPSCEQSVTIIYEKYEETKRLEQSNTDFKLRLRRRLQEERERLAEVKREVGRLYENRRLQNMDPREIRDAIMQSIPHNYEIAQRNHESVPLLLPSLRKLMITLTIQKVALNELKPVNEMVWTEGSQIASEVVRKQGILEEIQRNNLEIYESSLKFWSSKESDILERMEKLKDMIPNLENGVKLGYIEKQQRAIQFQISLRLLAAQEQSTQEMISKMSQTFQARKAALKEEWKLENKKAWNARQEAIHNTIQNMDREIQIFARKGEVVWGRYPDMKGEINTYSFGSKSPELDKLDQNTFSQIVTRTDTFKYQIEHVNGRPFTKGAFRGAYKMKNRATNEALIGKVFHYRINPQADLENAEAVAKSTAICVEFARQFTFHLQRQSLSKYQRCTVRLLPVSTMTIRDLHGKNSETTIMIEEELPVFDKWNSPSGQLMSMPTDLDAQIPFDLASAFSHFTYAISNKRILIADIQGSWNAHRSEMVITDPAVHLIHEDLWNFRILMDANYEVAVDEFFEGPPKGHACNDVCRSLGIDRVNPNSAPMPPAKNYR
ncbi:hypothetical protein HK098_002545 [Nowakowskiella sp. JEL0407]|nr:hypothetical protein HK098_002545 [Nowakowskiella sp. JEL0407]